MSKKQKAVLSVSYDVDQISGALLWRISEDDGTRNLLKATGPHAGSVHLVKGDQVFVDVYSTGLAETLIKTRVLNAYLISIPHTSGMAFCAPSLFSNDSAVISVGDWGKLRPVEPPDPVEDRKYFVQRSKQPLIVIQQDGRWELSLVITVAIETNGPDGKSEKIRVFSFDPEAEVGTGTEPPNSQP
ncbi:MAG TPA: hypothetical protein DDZ76_02085 [Xanthomonadales bacterium]|nr:hypothetical protein [Xanthomonadales bacterium]